MNNFDGPLLSSIVKTAASNHFLAKQLMVLVKELIMVQELNSPKDGHLSSVAYCFLCVIVLQLVKVFPKFTKTDLKQLEDLLTDPQTDPPNPESGTMYLKVSVPPSLPILYDLLYRFFRFFIYEHNFEVYAVSVTRSRFKEKAKLGWPHFDNRGKVVQQNMITIENPFKRENLAKSIGFDGLEEIQDAFPKPC